MAPPTGPPDEQARSSSWRSTSSAASPWTPRAAADSGHTGTAMALAPLAHVLCTRVMRHDPTDPEWPDRDRFVLSNGHASILLYSMLYLTGYDLTLDDLKAFRQWGSRTPGHPEHRHTAGVEVTTGPLGPGVRQRGRHGRGGAGAADPVRPRARGPPHLRVSPATAASRRASRHEAASLAGHLGLGRLVCVYDDNHIIDRRPDRARLHRRRARAVRRLRLGRRRRRRGGQRHRRARGRPPPGDGGGGPPVADRAAQPHRLAGPAPDRHGQGARRPRFRRRRSEPPRRSSGCRRTRPSGSPTRSSTSTGACVPQGEALRAGWEDRLRRLGRRPSRPGTPARPASGLTGWEAKLPTFETGERDRHPQGRQRLPQRHRRPHSRHWWPARADLTGNTGMQMKDAQTPVRRASRWPPAVLRHPRARRWAR